MGYEVMDVGGAPARARTSQPVGAEPLDVDPLDVVPIDLHSPVARPGGRADDRGDRPGGVARRWVAGALALGVVAGVLLGALVADHRADAAALEARHAALVVDARIATSAITSQRLGEARAEITARVRNLGPEPVELLLDPATATPTVLTPVTVTGEAGELAPGASSEVRANVTLVCGVQPLPTLAVQVRTSDGRQHAVPLQPFGNGDPLEALCGNVTNSTPRVQAELQGTVDRPVLRIRNTRSVSVVVDLPEAVSNEPQSLRDLVSIRAGLPVVVAALSERTVPLTVTAARCERDLEVLDQVRAFARPTLRLTDVRGDQLDSSSARDAVGTNVDLTELVSQALARACR